MLENTESRLLTLLRGPSSALAALPIILEAVLFGSMLKLGYNDKFRILSKVNLLTKVEYFKE